MRGVKPWPKTRRRQSSGSVYNERAPDFETQIEDVNNNLAFFAYG